MPLEVSAGPHFRVKEDSQNIMLWLVVALLPSIAASVYFFGWNALILIVFTTLVCVAAEALFQRLAGQPVDEILNGSAVVTGILLALILPPGLPLWLAAIGALIAIVVVKGLFGGLGFNIFNPALAARAMLLASWPLAMTTWVRPFDALTSATPLYLVNKLHQAAPTYLDMFLGNRVGCLGETSALAILLGAAVLFYKKIIDWPTPVAYIGAVALLSLILGHDPLFAVLSGGLLLGAFFMATDYVTGPITGQGRFIFGLGCGLITVLIRYFGGFPEGVNYAILFMNMLTPVIDKYSRPRVFGSRKK